MIVRANYGRSGSLPRQPTPAPPGSEEKIRVMTERAARREQLFHPLDGPAYREYHAPEPDVAEEDWPFALLEEPSEPTEMVGKEDAAQPACCPCPAADEPESTAPPTGAEYGLDGSPSA